MDSVRPFTFDAYIAMMTSNRWNPSNYQPRYQIPCGSDGILSYGEGGNTFSLRDTLEKVDLFQRQEKTSWSHTLGKPLRYSARIVGILAIALLVAPVGALWHGANALYYLSSKHYRYLAKERFYACLKDAVIPFALVAFFLALHFYKGRLTSADFKYAKAIPLFFSLAFAGGIAKEPIRVLAKEEEYIPLYLSLTLKDNFGIVDIEGRPLPYYAQDDQETSEKAEDVGLPPELNPRSQIRVQRYSQTKDNSTTQPSDRVGRRKLRQRETKQEISSVSDEQLAQQLLHQQQPLAKGGFLWTAKIREIRKFMTLCDDLALKLLEMERPIDNKNKYDIDKIKRHLANRSLTQKFKEEISKLDHCLKNQREINQLYASLHGVHPMDPFFDGGDIQNAFERLQLQQLSPEPQTKADFWNNIMSAAQTAIAAANERKRRTFFGANQPAITPTQDNVSYEQDPLNYFKQHILKGSPAEEMGDFLKNPDTLLGYINNEQDDRIRRVLYSTSKLLVMIGHNTLLK